jgi:hypothetical protein
VANELYASLGDINAHLPIGKAQIEDADDDLLQVEAFRFIRARLGGSFAPATMALWTEPDDTPEIIRTIAGLIIAAKWYANLYAEDSLDDSQFAQDLYNQALALIQSIIDGTVTVIGPDGEPIDGSSFGATSFWPNDDAPVFTMGMELG